MSPTTKTIAIAAASGAAAALGGLLISKLLNATPRQENVQLLGEFREVTQVVTNYGARLGGLEGRVSRLEGRVASLETSRYAYREREVYNQVYAPTYAPNPAPRPSPQAVPRQDEQGMARLLRELTGASPVGPGEDDPVTRRFQLLEVD